MSEQHADPVAGPWPLDPLPFGYHRWPGCPAEPATVALLMHRIRCLTETIQEIGESLEGWWDSEGEAQHPIQESGYRDLPRFYEQWLMNAAFVADCDRLVDDYTEAVRPLYAAHVARGVSG